MQADVCSRLTCTSYTICNVLPFTYNRQTYYMFVFFSRFDRIVDLPYLLLCSIYVCLCEDEKRNSLSHFRWQALRYKRPAKKLKSILFYLYYLMRLNWQFVILGCPCRHYNSCARKCSYCESWYYFLLLVGSCVVRSFVVDDGKCAFFLLAY